MTGSVTDGYGQSGSIGDWFGEHDYSNRDTGQVDWQNDDLPDRSSTSWLDRMGADATTPRPTAGKKQKRRLGTRSRPSKQTAVHHSSPCERLAPAGLAAAMRRSLAQRPGITAPQVVTYLRAQGIFVTQAEIMKFMGGHEVTATRPRPPMRKGSAPLTPASPPKPEIRCAPANSPAVERPPAGVPVNSSGYGEALARAVLRCRTDHPQLSYRHVSEPSWAAGWSRIEHTDIERIMQRAGSDPAPAAPEIPAEVLRPPKVQVLPKGVASSSSGYRGALAKAVITFLRANPGASYLTAVELFRAAGWSNVQRADISSIMKNAESPQRPAARKDSVRRKNLVRAAGNSGRWIRSVQNKPRTPTMVPVCDACSSPVNVLGMCRCS